MARPGYQGQRDAVNPRKYGIRAALNLFNTCHRQSRWIHTIYPTGGQQITHGNIRVGGHKAQLHGVRIARGLTVGHTARSSAGVNHRRRMVAVGDQGDFAHQGKDARNLSEHATLVEHRRAQAQTLHKSFVNNHFAAVGVGRVVQHLCSQGGLLQALLQRQ